MRQYFADLHVHIGRTASGRAVKITGSRTLTLSNILRYSSYPKGLHMTGIIDCHSPEVIQEIELLIEKGELTELDDGGFQHESGLVLIPGSELEINDETCKGPIHVLAYFPDLKALKSFSVWLGDRVTNVHLSSQRIYAEGKELQEKVKALGGLFIPAHIFTPFKSLYGKGVSTSLSEVFYPEMIDAVELGLSSNTAMANNIAELHGYPFLTNSDAHSLAKMAREYNSITMASPSFNELAKALKNQEGRKIAANYGLDPLLGKYYETTCNSCEMIIPDKAGECPECGHTRKIRGVKHRIAELSGDAPPPVRPPYIPQIPLEYIPGLGPKTLEKLLNHFGTEMDILHFVPREKIAEVTTIQLAESIHKARIGELVINAGGGGRYGRVSKT
ncbi:endonuclease Q family protein [Bacillus sp. SG-1]|uniref:endonuclease Q family protein n=1 Tax=Bacillus sp. SG-1 TaxID=161544 RepID=UPI0001543054|nr:endonuclease Q family protein [Bacillus sp. SG-1]EDL64790.1 YqxK [Bacillus sp. SG-1]